MANRSFVILVLDSFDLPVTLSPRIQRINFPGEFIIPRRADCFLPRRPRYLLSRPSQMNFIVTKRDRWRISSYPRFTVRYETFDFQYNHLPYLTIPHQKIFRFKVVRTRILYVSEQFKRFCILRKNRVDWISADSFANWHVGWKAVFRARGLGKTEGRRGLIGGDNRTWSVSSNNVGVTFTPHFRGNRSSKEQSLAGVVV